MPRSHTGQHRAGQPGDTAGQGRYAARKAPGNGKGIDPHTQQQAGEGEKGEHHDAIHQRQHQQVAKKAVRGQIAEAERRDGQGAQLCCQRNAGAFPQQAAPPAAAGGRPQAGQWPGQQQDTQGSPAGEQKAQLPHGGGVAQQQNRCRKAQPGQAIAPAAPQGCAQCQAGHQGGTQHAGAKPGQNDHGKTAQSAVKGFPFTAPQQQVAQFTAYRQQNGKMQPRNRQQVTDARPRKGGAQPSRQVSGIGSQHSGDQSGAFALAQRI